VIAEKAYTFLGFQAPLLADGSATIQQSTAGRTIPVKLRLSRNGAPAADAVATIAVYKILNAASGTVDTTDLTADAGTANDSGNTFRRVAVFLKGCPLRCAWCHSPESQSSRPELLIKTDRCLVCGTCAPIGASRRCLVRT
jgi:hypothetical protein